MKIQLRITPNEGEPYELETNLFVVVAWERKFKQKASSLANGIGMLQTTQRSSAHNI
jgi:hypothetical protein